MTKKCLLGIIQDFHKSKKLGVLGEYILLYSGLLAELRTNLGEEISHAQMTEDMAKCEMYVQFGSYSSSTQKEIFRIAKEREVIPGTTPDKTSNFTLFIKIKNAPWSVHPSHLQYNGSIECFEEEMRRDSRVLNSLGFNIHYGGYVPEFDVEV